MKVCQIIGYTVFALSMLQVLVSILSVFFKNIITTYMGFLTLIVYSIFPCFCVFFEYSIFTDASHAWGVTIFFIFLNVYYIGVTLLLYSDTLIFFRKKLLRIKFCVIPTLYNYQDVKGYVFKNSSGSIYTKAGSKNVITYDTDIFFRDGSESYLAFRNKNSRKARQLEQQLINHKCSRNGRSSHSKVRR